MARGLTAVLVLSCLHLEPCGTTSSPCDALQAYRTPDASTPPCKGCLFPTYPGLTGIQPERVRLLDLRDKWIYFLGDVTLRQMYGEFAALVHTSQVKA